MAETTDKPAETKPADGAAPKAEPTVAELMAAVEKLTASSKAANAEAKTYREQLEALSKAKADEVAKAHGEAKAAAEKNGEWAKLFELQKSDAAKLAAELEAAKAKAAEADGYASVLKGKVDALAAQLGPAAAKAIEGLPLKNQLATLEILAANAAGPGAAKPPPSGMPAAPGSPIDFSKMTKDEVAAHFAGKTPEQILEAVGAKRRGGLFGS